MATRGWNDVTEAQAAQMGRKGPRKAQDARSGLGTSKGTRSKYGAVKTTVDGIAFDSAKESRRYRELLNLSRVGQVRGLRVQPRYTLCALVVDGAELADVNAGAIVNRRHPVCEYVADFVYQEPAVILGGSWRWVVEDVKSVATRKKEVYRLKRKLFEAQYGIQIREV